MRWEELPWREWMHKERPLLRELALILVVSLVIGIYFLEHVHSTLEHSQRRNTESLAQHLATSSAEYMVTGNLVSLNVIATHTARLETVRRMEFRSVAGIVLASAGLPADESVPVSRAVRLEDNTVAGTVELWSADINAERERNLESNFVLVVLCLLGLRIGAEVIWRKLQQERQPDDEDVEADRVPVLTMSHAVESPRASLRISIVNFDRMKERLTPALIEEMVSAYRQPLEGLCEVYGARLNATLGAQCALEFRSQSRADAAFQALCAGMLFRRLAKSVTEQRKARGRTPLEFKLLVTTDSDVERSWSVCIAGSPGRVHIPESELVTLELDARVLYKSDRCLDISDGNISLRLQPIEQLAQRYQKLISDQAQQLLPAESRENYSEAR